MGTNARAELESYLDGVHELDAQRASGALDRLNYLIILNHREAKLAERCYVAFEALELALQRLRAVRREKIWGIDPATKEQGRVFIRTHLRPVALKLLEAFELIPEPPPS